MNEIAAVRASCKGFGKAGPRLLKQVFVRGGSCVRVAEEGTPPVLSLSDRGEGDDSVWRRGFRIFVHFEDSGLTQSVLS